MKEISHTTRNHQQAGKNPLSSPRKKENEKKPTVPTMPTYQRERKEEEERRKIRKRRRRGFGGLRKETES